MVPTDEKFVNHLRTTDAVLQNQLSVASRIFNLGHL